MRAGFNPRTHAGCDDVIRFLFVKRLVSIHAPTRGATQWSFLPNWSDNLFQSTHPRGVRRALPRASVGRAGFQSTHPRGVRLRLDEGIPQRPQVSIHAPTRGATFGRYELGAGRNGFNPRTHAGCDITACRKPSEPRVSIHAPTRGAT